MNTRPAAAATAASPSFLALAGTVVLWAAAFPAIRVGVAGLGVAALSLLRLAIAAAVLAAVAPLTRVRIPSRRDLPLIALAGATGMTAYQVLLNWGEEHVAAGTSSLLVVSAPVFSVLLAAVFLAEPVTRTIVAGSAVALAGCAVVALAGNRAGFSASAFAVLGAAAVQGTYHIAIKPLLRSYTGLEVATYAMVAGTVFALPMIPAAAPAIAHARPGPIAAAVFLGLLPSALGFVIWGHAVARLPIAIATAALYFVPPVTLLVAFVWLGEVPRPIALVGGAVAVLGVALINRRPRRRPAAAPQLADAVRAD
ncbi:MAG TPA: DMT family transporter [Actinocrinis sp.]